MHTIVLATQKGGSGKSTLAIGLALAAKQAGHTVRLIETDSQGTLSNWQSRRGPTPSRWSSRSTSAGDIESAAAVPRARRRDARRSSTPPAASAPRPRQRSATADLCLIPARPSVADIEASGVDARARPRLATSRSRSSSTRPDPRPADQPRRRRARRRRPRSTWPTCWRSLSSSMRNDHQDALRAGLAVSEYAPSGKSADEIRRPLAMGRRPVLAHRATVQR